MSRLLFQTDACCRVAAPISNLPHDLLLLLLLLLYHVRQAARPHVKEVQSLQPAQCMLCRFLVESARERGLEVIDRCNLTVLLEPGQEHLAQYLAQHQVCPMLFFPTCICSQTRAVVAFLIWVVKVCYPFNLQREPLELLFCTASFCID